MNEDKHKADFAQAIKHMRENMLAMLEFENLNAKRLRKKFLALQAEGFTVDQALELCKKG